MSVSYTRLGGGLDLVNNPNSVDPGRSILSINYETPITGGYRSTEGYTDIGAPAGTGELLGLTVWNGDVYAIRKNTTVHLYKWDGVGTTTWTSVGSGLFEGRHDFVEANFFSLASSENLFMVGGGKVWKYDGTTLSEIADSPTGAKYIDVHANHLFLGFEAGSVQWSATGNPDDWDALNGAGEAGISDKVTSLDRVSGGVLVIGGQNSIKTLYGTSNLDFTIKEFSSSAGVAPYTSATIGTIPVFRSSAGLTSMTAVQSFSDFQFGSWAQEITPLFGRQSAEPVCAMALKNKNQYRLYWESGLGIVATFNGETPVGISTTIFPHQVHLCATGASDTPGTDLSVFSNELGNVYHLDSAESFAGQQLKTYLALGYNHFQGPSVQKRFRHLYLDVLAESAVELSVLPTFNLGSSLIPRHLVSEATVPTQILDALSAGGLWEFDNWGEFTWGSPILDMTHLRLFGSATHLGIVVNTASTTDKPHTIHGYTTHYDARRLRRG